MRKVILEIPESVYEAMRYDDRQVKGILKYAGQTKVDFLPTLVDSDDNNPVHIECVSGKAVKSITFKFKGKEEINETR